MHGVVERGGSDPYKSDVFCVHFDLVLRICWHSWQAVQYRRARGVGVVLLVVVSSEGPSRWKSHLCFWCGHKSFTTQLFWSRLLLLAVCFPRLLIWRTAGLRCVPFLKKNACSDCKVLFLLLLLLFCDGTDDCEASMADTDLMNGLSNPDSSFL